MRHRIQLYHAFVKYRRQNLLKKVEKQRNKLKSDIRLAKGKYHTDKFFRNIRRQKIWDAVNEITNRRNPGTLMEERKNNCNRVNGRDLADLINTHFISVGTSPLPCMASQRHTNIATPTMTN